MKYSDEASANKLWSATIPGTLENIMIKIKDCIDTYLGEAGRSLVSSSQ